MFVVCRSVVGVLLAGCLISSTALAQSSGLSGVVRDISGAVVSSTIIVRQYGSSVEQVLETGANGAFSIAPIGDGEYLIEVIAPGFGVLSRAVTVPIKEPLDLTLAPAPVVEAVHVVSASRLEELRERLNTNVAVLSKRQLDESGSQTVAEALREVPGVVSRRGSETAGPAGEQIQGIDSRQVLVLLDGQPLIGARGIKRGVINLDRQTVGPLEQVEVVKGASSALYGSDAIGGVINLITREVAAPVETLGEVSGGSLGEVNVAAQAGFRRNLLSGLVSAERHQNDGFDLTPTTFDTTGAPFRRIDLTGRARLKATETLTLSGLVAGYDNRTEGRSNGELGPQEDRIDDRSLTTNAQANWLPRPLTSVEARVYHARYDERSSATLAPPASTVLAPGELSERLLKIDASFSHVLGLRQQLQGGAELWRDEYAGINRVRNDDGEQASTSTGWLQHRMTFGSRVTTTLGLRADHHSDFGAAISPKIAANARVRRGVHVRASYGRGFRAPDIGQLYYRFLNPSSIYQVIGNKNLRAEYADSLQVGAELATPARRARFGVNLFRNDVRDLIESVNLGFPTTSAQVSEIFEREGLDPSFRPVAGRLLFTYKNINDARTSGIEADSEWAMTTALSVSGAYTYLEAKDRLTNLALTGRHTHQGNVRLTWRHRRSGLTANLRGTFYSGWIASRATVNGKPIDTTAPGFALWDAFVSQRILRGLNAFAAIDNLADNTDPNAGLLSATGTPLAIYRPEVGRTARFGLRWSWSR